MTELSQITRQRLVELMVEIVAHNIGTASTSCWWSAGQRAPAMS